MSKVVFYVVKMEYDIDSNLVYRGGNTQPDAAEDNTSWYVWRYSWDADGNCIEIKGPLTGSWAGRAGLGW